MRKENISKKTFISIIGVRNPFGVPRFREIGFLTRRETDRSKAGFPLANIVARSDFFPLSLSFRLIQFSSKLIRLRQKKKVASRENVR